MHDVGDHLVPLDELVVDAVLTSSRSSPVVWLVAGGLRRTADPARTQRALTEGCAGVTAPPPPSTDTPPDVEVPEVWPTSFIVKLMFAVFWSFIATNVWLTGVLRITTLYSCGRSVRSATACAGFAGGGVMTTAARTWPLVIHSVLETRLSDDRASCSCG